MTAPPHLSVSLRWLRTIVTRDLACRYAFDSWCTAWKAALRVTREKVNLRNLGYCRTQADSPGARASSSA